MELQKRVASKSQRLFDKTPKPLTDDRRNFYLSKCHENQQKFLTDTARFKALICPRRTGKTTTTLFHALMSGETFPGSTIFYIVPDSKSHARRLFWKPLREMNTALQLGLEFFEADKRVVMPNGAQIMLFGARDKNAPIQLRGDALSLAILDECKDFGPHFEEMVVEAVLPALGDYGGTLILAGTPGSVLAGRFYEVTAKRPKGWSVHHWIKSDNSFLPDDERDLKKVLEFSYKPFGYDEHSPKFRREQLAEWIADDTERLYLYDPIRNGWNGVLPEGHKWMYAMGVDFGERDANAFIVGAFALTHKHLYIIEQYARPRMSIDEIAIKIQEYRQRYNNFVAIVGDTGGYGRGIVTDLQDRHGLPIEAAEKKKDKLGTIQQMNSDFLSGKIMAVDGSPITLEWKKLIKRIRPSDQKVMLDHTDLGDAALYMWKAALHWTAYEIVQGPAFGTKEYYQKHEQDAIMKAVKRRKADWWGNASSDEK